jgi:hypothetical protein
MLNHYPSTNSEFGGIICISLGRRLQASPFDVVENGVGFISPYELSSDYTTSRPVIQTMARVPRPFHKCYVAIIFISSHAMLEFASEFQGIGSVRAVLLLM